ncbi:DUF4132 domain-containing protein [Catenuloplanes atrovinosus]|uniref:DUF4132 domain-containing protein n=1 Tax=Catenuloplanes atrovinosus TaxID=137266 RepID=A0AAE3YPZ5_9ACTN|nr:DUF4132 domain-containing protein [Catenuloplanes atrovinosus]MDR7277132.1 hypothetical protein [Catenuloplanes atrovinosus]
MKTRTVRERAVLRMPDVPGAAADTVQRLEAALAEQRRWTGAELRVLAAHRCCSPIGRHLLWVTADGTAFRIAEDRTLADAGDAPAPLDDDAEVRLAHPALGIDAAPSPDLVRRLAPPPCRPYQHGDGAARGSPAVPGHGFAGVWRGQVQATRVMTSRSEIWIRMPMM